MVKAKINKVIPWLSPFPYTLFFLSLPGHRYGSSEKDVRNEMHLTIVECKNVTTVPSMGGCFNLPRWFDLITYLHQHSAEALGVVCDWIYKVGYPYKCGDSKLGGVFARTNRPERVGCPPNGSNRPACGPKTPRMWGIGN